LGKATRTALRSPAFEAGSEGGFGADDDGVTVFVKSAAARASTRTRASLPSFSA
jgi:hypothetical protein